MEKYKRKMLKNVKLGRQKGKESKNREEKKKDKENGKE